MKKIIEVETTYTDHRVAEAYCDHCGVLINWDPDHGTRFPSGSDFPVHTTYYEIRKTYANGKPLDLCAPCCKKHLRSKEFFDAVTDCSGHVDHYEIRAEQSLLPNGYNQFSERRRLLKQKREKVVLM